MVFLQTVRVYITIIQSTSLLYRRKKERKKSNQKKERSIYIQKKEIYKERKERNILILAIITI